MVDWTDLTPVGRPPAATAAVPTGAGIGWDALTPVPNLVIPTTTARDVPFWGAADAIASGVALGYGPQIRAAGSATRNALPEWMGNAIFDPSVRAMPYDQALAEVQAARSGYMQAHPVLGPVLEYGGATVPVMAANMLTPGLPQSLGLAGRIGTGAIQGAEAGLMEHHLTGGSMAGDVLGGAAVGAAFPVAGQVLRAIPSPFTADINPLVAQTARDAGALGVNLRPGQIAMSNALQKADAALASGGNLGQLKDMTRAVSHTFGEDAAALTPDVMSAARDRLGKGFNDVAANTQIVYDQPLNAALNSVFRASGGLADSERAPVLRIIKNIVQQAAGGYIPGDVYQKLTVKNSPLGVMLSSKDSNVRYLGIQLRDALDGALERSSAPEQVAALRDLRSQWKNMMTVQPLVERAQPGGLLNPRDIAGRVRQNFNDYGWTAPGPLATLGEAGRFLPATTAQGEAAVGGGHISLPWWATAAGLAGETGLLMENPEHAAIAGAGLAGLYATDKALGGVLGSNWYRRLMLGQRVPLGANPLLPGAVGAVNANQLVPNPVF